MLYKSFEKCFAENNVKIMEKTYQKLSYGTTNLFVLVTSLTREISYLRAAM